MDDLQQVVAQSADTADVHATVPTLLLELQTMLGALSASVTSSTERGRRPYRPTDDWADRLGDLAYGVYLLADQTGVDLQQLVAEAARRLARQGAAAEAEAPADWPF